MTIHSETPERRTIAGGVDTDSATCINRRATRGRSGK